VNVTGEVCYAAAALVALMTHAPGRLIAVLVLGMLGCRDSSPPVPPPADSPRVPQASWGQTPDGRAVDLITLRNGAGVEVHIATLGGIITSLRVPDREGHFDDVVLGHDAVAGYFPNSSYFGAIIGRYGNRIGNGTFALDDTTYKLAQNNGPNHLHGGNKGWNQAIWRPETFQDASGTGVVLTSTSPDGDEGYPGTVAAKVTYTLTSRNELAVDYEATTDKPTIINLTQHSYFNLAGERATDILGHQLMINADRYTPVDDTLIPTGELAAVAGTPFDFQTSTGIGARIGQDNQQLLRGRGYDHNWVLTRQGEGLSLAARVLEPASGRTLEIATTEPGIQFYSGNFLDGSIKGKNGHVYGHRAGFCLETQHFPDSPNKPAFPPTTLRPGQTYRSRTVMTFGVAPNSR
jgi:aldose 1-epimerase